jgi:hypothetical protein
MKIYSINKLFTAAHTFVPRWLVFAQLYAVMTNSWRGLHASSASKAGRSLEMKMEFSCRFLACSICSRECALTWGTNLFPSSPQCLFYDCNTNAVANKSERERERINGAKVAALCCVLGHCRQPVVSYSQARCCGSALRRIKSMRTLYGMNFIFY